MTLPNIRADEAVDLLIAAGLHAALASAEILDISDGTTTRNAVVRVHQSDLSPRDLQVGLTSESGDLLYVVPRLTNAMRKASQRDPRLLFAAIRDEVVVLGGKEYRPFATAGGLRPSMARGRGRQPYGRYAVARALLRTSALRTQAQIGRETGLSQVAVSYILKALGALVRRDPIGWAAADPEILWSAVMNGYPGPLGDVRHWASPATSNDQQRVVETAAPKWVDLLISGSGAADVWAPGHAPTRAIVYGSAALDLAAWGFSESTPDAATLEYRVPMDGSLWPTSRAWSQKIVPLGDRLADPIVTAWEVRHSGGPEAEATVDRLKHVAIDRWAVRR
jgi:hypothetical protein